jgi:S-adenosylmethionine:tRNA ribosyltransferase-isomerase
MKLDDFDFALPATQVAQFPAPERDASRLLCLSRASGELRHAAFRDLPSLLQPSDLIVVNDTRVIAARLVGKKVGTGGRAELLLSRPAAQKEMAAALELPPDALEWICLGQSSKALRAGARVQLENECSAEIVEALGDGEYRVRFSSAQARSLSDFLKLAGRVPLPPYVERAPNEMDVERYQTVYAQAPGSVAAPTAGLHFTRPLMRELEERGIRILRLSLEVGPGTFLPIRDGDIEGHRMHSEKYAIPEQTAAEINRAKAEGRRVVAVGTTVVRTLEAATEASGALRAGSAETSLFIRPGFRFRQVDALLTNFHLPKSTLLILVSAFAGRGSILAAYREAVQRGYRFFSYGDAMLIAE